jgi:hypothetical protein
VGLAPDRDGARASACHSGESRSGPASLPQFGLLGDEGLRLRDPHVRQFWSELANLIETSSANGSAI